MVIREKKINKSGFTLMELMVAIAIIAIMSGIAIPNIIGWLPGYRLRSATRDIVSCLQNAKLRAVKENERVVVSFDEDNESYQSFIDINSNGSYDATETIVGQKTVPEGIDIKSSAIFIYSSRGLLAGGIAGTITMENTKSQSTEININLAGSIRVDYKQ